MMSTTANRFQSFLAGAAPLPALETTPTPDVDADALVVPQRDGLLERTEVINPRRVTTDGRQLLREQRYESTQD